MSEKLVPKTDVNYEFVEILAALLRGLTLPDQVRAIEQLGSIGSLVANVPVPVVWMRMAELGIKDMTFGRDG